MELRENERIQKGFGLVTWMFFFFAGGSFVFFLLSSDTDFEIKSTFIFITAFIVALLLMMLLAVLGLVSRERVQGIDDEPLWFMRTPSVLEVIVWVPLGIGAVYFISLASVIIGQPFYGLLGAGAFFALVLYMTRSILVTIFIHGIYNGLIVLDKFDLIDLNSGGFPITVPEVGLQFEVLGRAGTEFSNQIAVVATSEEAFRVLLISGAIVATEGDFEQKKLNFFAGGVFSTIVWAVYHLFQSGFTLN